MAEEEAVSTEKEAMDLYKQVGELLAPQNDSLPSGVEKQGVMQTYAHSVTDDSQNRYRQTLSTANFADDKQASLAAAAINCLERYGLSPSVVINHLEAQKGVKGERVKDVLGAMSHLQMTTNYRDNSKGKAPQNRKSPL